jgi:hypothetical protein
MNDQFDPYISGKDSRVTREFQNSGYYYMEVGLSILGDLDISRFPWKCPTTQQPLPPIPPGKLIISQSNRPILSLKSSISLSKIVI